MRDDVPSIESRLADLLLSLQADGMPAADIVRAVIDELLGELHQLTSKDVLADLSNKSLRQELAESARALDAAKLELASARSEKENLRAMLEDLRQSEAYRFGRWVVEKPAAPLRALYHRVGDRGRRQPPKSKAALTSGWRFHGVFDPSYGARGPLGSIGFLTSSTDAREARGDFFVASYIGGAIRTRGYTVNLYSAEEWHLAARQCDAVVAMVAEPRFGAYRPLSQVVDAPAPRTLAWVRNNPDYWLAEGGLDGYDHVFASGQGLLDRLAAGGIAEVSLLPLAAPEFELGWPVGESGDRSGVLFSASERGGVRRSLQMLRQWRGRPSYPVHVAGAIRNPASLPDWVTYHGILPIDQLSELMRRVAVVVDDRQYGNLATGAVNSRIFESIACGALPISDSPAGMSELGLAPIPTFLDTEDLREAVDFYCANEAERNFLLSRLRAAVSSRHMYRHRATEVLKALRHEVTASAAPLSMRRSETVWVFPDYREGNPYLEMAYRNVALTANRRVQFVPVLAALRFPRAATAGDVIHLHWTAPILNPSVSPSDAAKRRAVFVSELSRARERGVRIIWTVHNRLPHDCRFLEEEHELRAAIGRLASAVHVHCHEHAAELVSMYDLEADAFAVVPHPTYGDYYGAQVPRDVARAALQFESAAPVLLSFGKIRPYKRLDDVIDAFDRVRVSLPGATLLVAGELARFPDAQRLANRLDCHPAVTWKRGRIPDSDVPSLFAASDVVVMANDGSVNSGVVALAATYHRPVVAPGVGCLAANGAPGQVETYDPLGGTDSLAAAIVSVASRNSGDSASWGDAFSPEEFAAAIAELMDGGSI